MTDKLSFDKDSYDHEANCFGIRNSHKNQFGAKTPPLSIARVCLPNSDGEYRPYKETTEAEFYVSSSAIYYFLGATACPKILKCAECPLKN